MRGASWGALNYVKFHEVNNHKFTSPMDELVFCIFWRTESKPKWQLPQQWVSLQVHIPNHQNLNFSFFYDSLQCGSLQTSIVRLVQPLWTIPSFSPHHFITPILNHIQVKSWASDACRATCNKCYPLPDSSIRRNIYPSCGAEATPNPSLKGGQDKRFSFRHATKYCSLLPFPSFLLCRSFRIR